MPGWIYALELSNETVKVGKASSFSRRLEEHVKQAKCYGVEVNEVWQAVVDDPTAGELRLIEFAEKHGGRLIAGREWFADANFDGMVFDADEEFGGWCPPWDHEHPHPLEALPEYEPDLGAYDPEVFYRPKV